MLPFAILLMIAAADETYTASRSVPAGILQGAVIDGTSDGQPLTGINVILRAGVDGDFIPVAETQTDRYGKFVFEQLPLDPTIVYLPGANREGIHYPGQRVRLNESNRIEHVTITSFATNQTTNPLISEQHEIDIEVESQSMKITETLLLSNPTRETYVGRSEDDKAPLTFLLSIPKNFDRVTFDKEFFGRRFVVVDHSPATDVPWLPGKQELRFSYRIPLDETEARFRRPLDLPCSEVRVRVRGTSGSQVSSNLPRVQADDGEVAFASTDESILNSFILELEISALPLPWAKYARWGTLFALITLATTTFAICRFRSCNSVSENKAKI